MLQISIILFFLLGCYDATDFEGYLEKNIYATSAYEILNPMENYKSGHKGARNTWYPFLRLSVLGRNFTLLNYCLYSRMGEKAQVKIVKTSKNCSKAFYLKGRLWEGKTFSYQIEDDELTLFLDGIPKKYYFYNRRKVIGLKKFSGPKYTKMIFLRRESGKKLSIVTGQCLFLNKNCEVIRDVCQRCEGGSYLGVSHCRKKFPKFCGRQRCGKLNELACLRGVLFPKYSGGQCHPQGPVGFCIEGEVVCRDSILYCQ